MNSVLTAVVCMQPAQMRSGGSESSVMTDTDYAEAVSVLLVLIAEPCVLFCLYTNLLGCFPLSCSMMPEPGCSMSCVQVVCI